MVLLLLIIIMEIGFLFGWLLSIYWVWIEYMIGKYFFVKIEYFIKFVNGLISYSVRRK